MRLDKDFIKKVIPHGEIINEKSFPENPVFSVDSRSLKAGEIFVALAGNRVDGHDFLPEVLKKGAAGFLIATAKKSCLQLLDQKLLANICVIIVEDPLQTLIALAKAWRAHFDFPVVGITGSIGKTTTKQILATILEKSSKNYLVSTGNQNTALGISLNLLRLNAHHEGALIEMGISKRGEMEKLVDIVKPTIGVVTGIAHSHMEGLGSIVDIATEKRTIFKLFKENNIGIINGDQQLLANIAYSHPVIKVGSKTTNQIQARKIQTGVDTTSFILKIYGEKHSIILKNNHRGFVFNALSAAAVAYLLNIPVATIIEGISQPWVVPGRFEKRSLKKGKGILINDCYNANPESMKSALLAFQAMPTKAHKVAVLGDMLELGVNSPFWHRQLGRFLRKVPSLRHIILVGSMVEWTKKTMPLGVKIEHVPTWQDAIPYLEEKLNQETAILVKGSNGVGLTNLVNVFT